jgi:hypothetical protein
VVVDYLPGKDPNENINNGGGSSGGSSGGKGKKDSFRGRLVIGPLFLTIFDILTVLAVVVAVMLDKKQDSKFILESTKM